MQHAACGMQYAVWVMRQKFKPMVIVWAWFLTTDFQFATARGMWCKNMNHDMSWFMRHANANSDGEIQKLMSQVRVSVNFDNTRDSQQVRPDVCSPYTPFNTPWYAPCSSHLFKMLWTHQRHFLLYNFFLHIKWYAIAMIIKSLCSISNHNRCNADWQGGMLWLGGLHQKDWKLHSVPYIRILSCCIPHAANHKTHAACLCRMPCVRIPSFTGKMWSWGWKVCSHFIICGCSLFSVWPFMFHYGNLLALQTTVCSLWMPWILSCQFCQVWPSSCASLQTCNHVSSGCQRTETRMERWVWLKEHGPRGGKYLSTVSSVIKWKQHQYRSLHYECRVTVVSLPSLWMVTQKVWPLARVRTRWVYDPPAHVLSTLMVSGYVEQCIAWSLGRGLYVAPVPCG